jgi:hypothetical protein
MNKKKWVLFIVLMAAVVGIYALLGGLSPDVPDDPGDPGNENYVEYTFRNDRLLTEHFEKHGREMGFASKEEYQKAASDVINDPDSLHKLEKEDGDDVYYKVESNEFVVLSKDGFIRTYFCPDSGQAYFDKQ